jgi:hypothetical protein
MTMAMTTRVYLRGEHGGFEHQHRGGLQRVHIPMLLLLLLLLLLDAAVDELQGLVEAAGVSQLAGLQHEQRGVPRAELRRLLQGELQPGLHPRSGRRRRGRGRARAQLRQGVGVQMHELQQGVEAQLARLLEHTGKSSGGRRRRRGEQQGL